MNGLGTFDSPSFSLLMDSKYQCTLSGIIHKMKTSLSTHILCPKSLTAEELALNHSLVARATTFMIDNPTQLFSLPEKLLTEVQTIISRR